MNDDEKVIICGKVGHSSVVPGSDIEECHECHHPVWFSPSSKKIKKELELNFSLKILCVDCAQPLIKAAKPGDICPSNNGQLQEVADYFGISVMEASKRLEEILKSHPEELFD